MTHHEDSLAALVDHLSARSPRLHLLRMLSADGDEEFDAALEGVMEEAVAHLEKNARHLTDCDEETLSAFLVAYLNMPGFLRALQEAHSNGHVDITIEAEPSPPMRRRLGEAKIYNGPSKHVKGLMQLVSRYSTGREGAGFMVEYVKKPNIKAFAARIRNHMDKTKPCEQKGDSRDHRIRWAFSTRHRHDSGETLRVLHVNCNMAPAKGKSE